MLPAAPDLEPMNLLFEAALNTQFLAFGGFVFSSFLV